jgi:hypothetical protein
MTLAKQFVCFASALALLTTISCGGSAIGSARDYSPNQPPTVSITVTKDDGSAYDTAKIEPAMAFLVSVSAKDPEGGTLSFVYSSENGKFSHQSDTASSSSALFTTDKVTGSSAVMLQVNVRDAKGAVTAGTFNLGTGKPGPVISATVDKSYIKSNGNTTIRYGADCSGSFQVFCDNATAAKDIKYGQGIFSRTYESGKTALTATISGHNSTSGIVPLAALGENRVWVVFRDSMNQDAVTSCVVIEDDKSLELILTSPSPGQTGLTKNGKITLTFNKELSESSLPNSLSLNGGASATYDSYGKSGNAYTVTYSTSGMTAYTPYTATISGISDLVGNVYSGTFSFMTEGEGLYGLGVSHSSVAQTVNASTLSYSLARSVPYSAAFTVTPMVSSGCTVRINGASASAGSANPVALAVGPNTVAISVTNTDGTVTPYTLEVYRAIPVFKTGQTTKYATGDDGDLRKGVAWPNPRFTDNGNGTITDNMTGLMWTKNANLKGSQVKWADALSYLSSTINSTTSPVGSYSDWRIPNIFELMSIIDLSGNNPLLLTNAGFTNVQTSGYAYFTSTVPISSTVSTYTIWFEPFSLASISRTPSSIYDYAFVWTVRGNSSIVPKTGASNNTISGTDGVSRAGVEWPNTRFFDNGDGTITDDMTNLTWYAAPFTSDGNGRTWSNVLSDVTNLNTVNSGSGTKGHNDWRMPNLNEIKTLSQFGQSYSPWLSSYGFSCGNHIIWVSTSKSSGIVYVMAMDSSEISGSSTGYGYYTLPVRGGD